MSYRIRKLLCVVVLVAGLPVYVVLAVSLVSLFDRPSFVVEIAVYVGLGILWALPLKTLFRGMGRAGPGQHDPSRRR